MLNKLPLLLFNIPASNSLLEEKPEDVDRYWSSTNKGDE
jgi:hypothetical protein